MNKIIMKTFTTKEIRDLFNRVMVEEISFSEMVEIMNERVNEFKDGDFVVGFGCIFIAHKQIDENSVKYHVLYAKTNGKLLYDKICWQRGGIDKSKLATEAEKQELLDALAKEGKRWNAEKKCVEDIPVRKFQKGDKVRIKDGVSNKTQGSVYPYFNVFLYPYIGRVMTVKEYVTACLGEYITTDEAKIEDHHFGFAEDWLESCVEELKKGDLAIFWDSDQSEACIRVYNRFYDGLPFPHIDHIGNSFRNAIKFESVEQYERLLKGEI